MATSGEKGNVIHTAFREVIKQVNLRKQEAVEKAHVAYLTVGRKTAKCRDLSVTVIKHI